MSAAQREIPGVPHVAVFDTAFFSDLRPERGSGLLGVFLHTREDLQIARETLRISGESS